MDKNTKKKEPTNKAHINSILEKYNLKAPKKTQILDKKQDYQIKPNQKLNEQIITVVKNKSTLPPNTSNTHNTPKLTQSIERPNSPKPIQQPIQRPNSPKTIERPKSPQQPIQQSIQQPIQRPNSPKPISIPPPQKPISINNLLTKDKIEINNNKNIIPQAIVSKNHAKDFLTNENIYNIIPKINPQKQYSHLPIAKQPQTTINNINNNNNITNTNYQHKQSGGVKQISINPNLNEDASQNYKGYINSQQNQQMPMPMPMPMPQRQIQMPQRQIQMPMPQRQIPIPQQPPKPQIKTIITQPKQSKSLIPEQTIPSSQSIPKTRYRIVKRHNNTNPNNHSTYNSNPPPETNNQIYNDNTTLSKLELQRQYLQDQQRKELEKLKFKKEQIMKIHNRKKEIELIKSIDKEKQKLRLIQTKQEELNKLFDNPELLSQEHKQIDTNIQIETQPQNQHKIININTSTTLKNKAAHNIYNVDEKKTKKNMSLMKDMKDVIDVIKQPSIITKIKPIKEPIITSIPIQEPIITSIPIIETIIEPNMKNLQLQNELKPLEITSLEKEVKEVKEVSNVIQELPTNLNLSKSSNKTHIKPNTNSNSNEPYKYYYKKDIKKYNLNVVWGTQEELYNRDTFDNNLTIVLTIEPIFNNKCIKKYNNDKKSLEEKIKILQSIYYFKKIKKIKENVIEFMYKLLVYDDTIIFDL